ncbi:MAG: hypothetical protein ACT4NU_03840 [Chromatiales bacterium]
MQGAVNFSEVVGFYSNAIELSLRTSKVLQNAVERSLREHLSFVEATVGQLAPVTRADQPADFVAAQSALIEGLRDQISSTTKNLLKIQQDTGAEIKALVAESVEKFSPEAVTKLFKAA